MGKEKPEEIHLSDYRETPFLIESIELEFDLYEERTIVSNKMLLKRQSEGDLFLQGEDLSLLSFCVDGVEITNYQVNEEGLFYKPNKNDFKLEIRTEIYPQKNLSLMGLYKSGNIFCTQNEAEGFRKITYFYDRPDVLTKYRTKIIADKNSYPFLLANGNKLEEGDLESGRHWVLWEDPHPKPSYLFALVAGDFDCYRDSFKTKSGRDVSLEIYVDKGNLGQCEFAMQSLVQSMKWDEERFGLEYDLDIYMIVAVDSFNMGAMENKGLNIFNSKYVLGNQKTATDDDFYGIQAVIGHEYFHNWTGNRVTCRDWFQLTLKEGLTVFRDQEFSSDLNSRPVKRIDDVKMLRGHQFIEDAGAFSHPIKPKSYIEINNFYTLTIYEKGAEVIRMIHTLIGEENFQKGMKKYFELYDGQAVTTEDFVHAMELASGFDFSHFRKWYDVKGTPYLKVRTRRDGEGLTVNLAQEFKGHEHEDVMLLPIKVKFFDKSGRELEEERCLLFNQKTMEVHSKGAHYVSLNRNFSAPVITEREFESDELYELIKVDDDPFNRWDYGQTLFKECILKNLYLPSPVFDSKLIDSIRAVIKDQSIDNHFKACFLKIPSEAELNEALEVYDFENVQRVREALKVFIGKELQGVFSEYYHKLEKENSQEWNAQLMGIRSLKNTVLDYLFSTNNESFTSICVDQFTQALTMTDRISALNIINYYNLGPVAEVNADFIKEWQRYPLVVHKWLRAQASSKRSDAGVVVKKLACSDYFNKHVPNDVYNLYGPFVGANLVNFYHKDGRGANFLVEIIRDIDSYNPQVASRILRALKNLKKLDKERRSLFEKSLESIIKANKISKDSFEVLSKMLG